MAEATPRPAFVTIAGYWAIITGVGLLLVCGVLVLNTWSPDMFRREQEVEQIPDPHMESGTEGTPEVRPDTDTLQIPDAHMDGGLDTTSPTTSPTVEPPSPRQPSLWTIGILQAEAIPQMVAPGENVQISVQYEIHGTEVSRVAEERYQFSKGQIVIAHASRQISISSGVHPSVFTFRVPLNAEEGQHSVDIVLSSGDANASTSVAFEVRRKEAILGSSGNHLKTWRDFRSPEEYGEYVKATLRVGMRVRALRPLKDGAIPAGLTGSYYGTGSGWPPCFVVWDKDLGTNVARPPAAPKEKRSHGYWVEWSDVEMLGFP
jgi:hypothetical protein